MGSKIFKTLDEQIEILEGKGLIVNNPEKVKEILYRENYFFINGYRHLFMRSYKDKKFFPGTTFEELYATFLFDRKIRNIMFKYILIIENNVKSKISYTLSKKYGFKEKNYLDPKNFNQDSYKAKQVNDVLNKMKRQIRVNGKQHSATMHYISNYGYIPMWILVKVLSLGIVSELFCILKPEDQLALAETYNLDSETMSIYLSLLSNYRNLCAHEDILYDNRTQRRIPDTKYHRDLDIDMTDDEYNFGKNDLYALVIIMKQMLTDNEFRELMYEVGYEIDILDGKVDTVPLNNILNKIGFPDNWRDIINME
ncbi:MAG: Abi family protein [Bacilli bacterium]|nr:Abi family protein [Bacilli bacterium]MDD4282787.1 Abi family protein [Bacilli bacterium]MDD4718351.1 Abi family protein [Bacilli bacterium]